ncbi:MAG: hypothetical protein JNM89_14415 [Hyphomicrobiaceae bacterium]|nr:hypothetical protein [Hyphomicrobiaceae bacterium]
MSLRQSLAPATALIAAFVLAGPAAAADCSKEVTDALAKQRSVSAMRQHTRMITERGPVDMTVDVLFPDRMHQRVKALIDPGATETILIGNRAWVSNGSSWQVLPAEEALDLSEEFQKNVVEVPKQTNRYECDGKVQVDGRELLAYRAVPEKGPGSGTIGITYVDPVTGLPVRTVMSTAEKPDRPFFKQDITYTPDIKIEPPQTGN